jgi:hypothetical protein
MNNKKLFGSYLEVVDGVLCPGAVKRWNNAL